MLYVTPQDLTFFAKMLSGRDLVECKQFLLENGLCAIKYEKGKIYKREDFNYEALPEHQEILLWDENRETHRYTIGYMVNGGLKTQSLLTHWTHAMLL